MTPLGATVNLDTTARDEDGALAAASAISLTILLPDGTTTGPFTPPAVTNPSLGAYRYKYVSVQAGRHIAEWTVTTAGGVGLKEETFDVTARWSEAGVVSLAEAKKQLNIDVADTDDDEEIAGMLRSVTAVCERYVGALGRTTYTETHRGGYGIALNRAPVLSLMSLVAAGNSAVDQTVAELGLDSAAGIVRRLDGGRMAGPLTVTYLAGRTSILPHVRQAALIILQHMWETQRGQMGGVRVGGSDEVYDPRFGFSIPRRAQELLGEQIPGIA